MYVVIVETVAEPRLEREAGISGHQRHGPRIMLREILDDDAALRNDTIARAVLEHRELADRPDPQERRALSRASEVDDVRRKWRVVLVEGDEHLPATRRQPIVVQRERRTRHEGARLGRRPPAYNWTWTQHRMAASRRDYVFIMEGSNARADHCSLRWTARNTDADPRVSRRCRTAGDVDRPGGWGRRPAPQSDSHPRQRGGVCPLGAHPDADPRAQWRLGTMAAHPRHRAPRRSTRARAGLEPKHRHERRPIRRQRAHLERHHGRSHRERSLNHRERLQT